SLSDECSILGSSARGSGSASEMCAISLDSTSLRLTSRLRSLVELQVSAAFAAEFKASDCPLVIAREHKVKPPFGNKLVGYRALEKWYLTVTLVLRDQFVVAHSDRVGSASLVAVIVSD